MATRPAPGTLVRFNDRCAWPERRGCYAVVVDTVGAEGIYPVHGLGANEVILFMQCDPLGSKHVLENGEPWTCATSLNSFDVPLWEAH